MTTIGEHLAVTVPVSDHHLRLGRIKNEQLAEKATQKGSRDHSYA